MFCTDSNEKCFKISLLLDVLKKKSAFSNFNQELLHMQENKSRNFLRNECMVSHFWKESCNAANLKTCLFSVTQSIGWKSWLHLFEEDEMFHRQKKKIFKTLVLIWYQWWDSTKLRFHNLLKRVSLGEV